MNSKEIRLEFLKPKLRSLNNMLVFYQMRHTTKILTINFSRKMIKTMSKLIWLRMEKSQTRALKKIKHGIAYQWTEVPMELVALTKIQSWFSLPRHKKMLFKVHQAWKDWSLGHQEEDKLNQLTQLMRLFCQKAFKATTTLAKSLKNTWFHHQKFLKQ